MAMNSKYVKKNFRENLMSKDFGLEGLRSLQFILLDFWLTVKAALHECVIRTSQP